VKLSDLVLEVPNVIRCGHAMELISPAGRGKSTFANWLVEEMSRIDREEWGKAELFLATQAPPDLQGYLFKGEVTFEGKTYSITDPTLPTWFICNNGLPVLAYKKGILILDEYSKGHPDTKAAGAELLLHGRIGKHYLPDGWARIALSNRQSDRSGDTKSLDFVINRRCEIHLSDDLRGTIEWYAQNGASRQMLAFLEATTTGGGVPICFEPPPEKQGPWMTPRSGFMADQYLRMEAAASGDPDNLPYDPLTVEIVQGYIGVPAATELFRALTVDREQPPYATIIADPDGVRVPDRPDAMMMVVYSLAVKAQDKHLSAILKYISRFPADFAITFTRALLRNSPLFVSHKAFREWANKNSQLIAQIASVNTASRS
jgi:hypothetical protein